MSQPEYIARIAQAEKDAAALQEDTRQKSISLVEQAAAEADQIIEKAYAEAEQLRREAHVQSEEKAKAILEQQAAADAPPPLSPARKQLAVDKIIERIVNTLGHR